MKNNSIFRDKRECSEETGVVFSVVALTSGLGALSSHLGSSIRSPAGAGSHGPCKTPLRLGENEGGEGKFRLSTFIKRVVTLQIP